MSGRETEAIGEISGYIISRSREVKVRALCLKYPLGSAFPIKLTKRVLASWRFLELLLLPWSFQPARGTQNHFHGYLGGADNYRQVEPSHSLDSVTTAGSSGAFINLTMSFGSPIYHVVGDGGFTLFVEINFPLEF